MILNLGMDDQMGLPAPAGKSRTRKQQQVVILNNHIITTHQKNPKKKKKKGRETERRDVKSYFFLSCIIRELPVNLEVKSSSSSNVVY